MMMVRGVARCAMSRTVQAVYEKGVFRPLGTVPEVREGSRVELTIRKPLDKQALRRLIGTLPAEDADAIMQAIKEGRRVEGDW
jgi:predicted DNA-binding antitoxin AbrB/MazE fold protein